MTTEMTVELTRAEVQRLIGNPAGLFYEGCECIQCRRLRDKLAPFTLAGITNPKPPTHLERPADLPSGAPARERIDVRQGAGTSGPLESSHGSWYCSCGWAGLDPDYHIAATGHAVRNFRLTPTERTDDA